MANRLQSLTSSAADEQNTVACDKSTSLRILVVDDSVGSAKMLRSLLKAIGHPDVELAHDGAAAIHAAEEFEPEVIFLDIGLPVCSGLEVARRLRRQPQFHSTRLVALTGYDAPEDHQESREAGFDQHLVKPVGVAEIAAVLADVASPGSPDEQNESE